MGKKDKNSASQEEVQKKAPTVKKVKDEKDDKTLSFDQINKELDKISLYGSKMSESTFSEVDEYISFGSYIVNACASGSIFGGIPNNRMVALAGPSGTGKTYLLLNAVKNAIDMGYIVIFYDTENAVDRQLMVKFGIDITKVRYEPMRTLQEFRHHIMNFIDTLIEKKRAGIKIPKIFFALDSAGNLPSQKEVDDAIEGNEKADMTRAKIIKSVFRLITVPLAELKAPFVFTNHTYQTQSFISLTKAGGGCLIPGSKVIMEDNSTKSIEDIKKGEKVMTLEGPKEILDTWNFDKPVIEIEFEDGSVITCSEEHRFFIGGDYMNDTNWIYAKDLVEGSEILQIK